jgi:hypothetical protein
VQPKARLISDVRQLLAQKEKVVSPLSETDRIAQAETKKPR